MGDQRFAFGAFLLDIERGMLLDRGTPVAVGSKGFAILRTLIEARGSVVTKSALLDAVWPATAIEESNLSVQIAQLRKRIGTSPTGEEWIATVPRVGYRFAGNVETGDRQALEGAVEGHAAAGAAKLAIAVLPFNNLSSDPEQEYFAQGLSEDLITDLSKVPGLLVIARNSSFAYLGRSIDVRQIARELGVRYVIEGSVRRAASEVRINAQIIDAVDHGHVWADRFDRSLSDIFKLQDEIVGRIVDALAGALPLASWSSGRRTTRIDAYDLFSRGRVLVTQSSESNRAAREPLERAIELDPEFADAYAWLAMSHVLMWTIWGEAIEPHRSLGRVMARRAITLDPRNSDAHWIHGYVRAYDGELAAGLEDIETALKINPNLADAWTATADLKVFEGRPLDGIDLMATAFRLNPYPPGYYYTALGWAQYAAGKYPESVASLSHQSVRGTAPRRVLAAALAQLGRMDEARSEARAFLASAPSFTIGEWGRNRPFNRDTDRQHFVDGYLKAGLPM
jgi:TolB-like protein